jgi:hypothetical protein
MLGTSATAPAAARRVVGYKQELDVHGFFIIKSGEESKPFAMSGEKYWEIIADNLSKAGWSWGCVSAVDRDGRTIWIADALRGDGKRFVVRADEKLTAFVELESAICTCSVPTPGAGQPTFSCSGLPRNGRV